jgi:hypothetical protein
MLRKLLPVIVVNALLIILFIISNFVIWNSVNGSYVKYTNGAVNGYFVVSHWNPISIIYTHAQYTNGEFLTASGEFLLLNFPFWLFFVAIAVNLYFIAKLAKSKVT